MACKGGTLKNGADKYYPNAYYEIGDLFFTTRSENPNLRFGGTWELYGKGKVLVCVDPDDSDFSAVKKTGGEKNHTLTLDEMPSHNHNLNGYTDMISTTGNEYYKTVRGSNSYGIGNTNNSGGDHAHNNLQPYITCYIWIRTE